MYLEHYGFKIEPFEIAPNANFLYLSKAHRKAFTYLNYALWNKDTFTLLTGDIGTGKTILLQYLLKTMPNTAEVITIYQTQLTPYELLYVIAEKLGISISENIPKPRLFQLINDCILKSKKNIVLVIDEAQSFSRETLEELRLLAGLDILTTKSNINIILCGQPELKNIIESGVLEQLNQRIKLRFHLTPLDFSETKEYISFRVQKAGQKLEIFTQDAIKRIFEYTNGLPRLTNILADTALTCGYADGFYAISSKQVDDAAKELDWKANYSIDRTHTDKKYSNLKNNNVINIQTKKGDQGIQLDESKIVTIFEGIEQQLRRIADSIDQKSMEDSNEKVK